MRDDSGATTPPGTSAVYQQYQPGETSQSATQVETTTELPQATASAHLPLMPRLARILLLMLPLVSASLLIVATWLPWATFRAVLGPDNGPGMLGGPSFDYDFSIHGSDALQLMLTQARPSVAYSTLKFLSLLWSIVPLFGLLIGLFHLRVRRLSRTPIAFYGVWLLLVTATTFPVIYGVLTTVGPLSCREICTPMPVTNRQPDGGLWVGIAGLVLGWLALGLLLRGRRSFAATAAAAPAVAAVRYSRLHRVGTGIMMLGAATWALGVFAVPWATSGCTGLHLSLNHFVIGTCSGVDGWDVFTAGIGRNDWMALVFLEVVPIMGLYVVIDIWLPRLARSTWIVAACWSLLQTLLFLVAIVGVQKTLAYPPVFTSGPHDPWVVSLGVFICGLGILLGWVGAGVLGRAEITQSRPTLAISQ